MTIRLFYSDPYLKEWNTHITKKFEKDHEYYATLAETAFYPHGGGQPCDIGYINDIAVLDVFTKENEMIHKVERFPDTLTVTCTQDWKRRFDHMQHHSGRNYFRLFVWNFFKRKRLASTLEMKM